MKIKLLVFALSAMLTLIAIAPVFAAQPTAIEDVWFVIPMFVKHPTSSVISFTPDKVWTSDEGTVLHSRNTQISTYIAHTPDGVPPGSIRWGTVTAVSDFVFDTITNTGTLNMKIILTLTASYSNNPLYPATDYPNTYGIGTLEGTLVATVTSLNPYVDPAINCPMPGAGHGYFIATHGTGAFENAKLSAGVTLAASQIVSGTTSIGIEYLFIGHHINHLYNDGTLTFHHPGPSQ